MRTREKEPGARGSNRDRFPEWTAYPLQQRHALWKTLLPSGLDPILAVGIGPVGLASLARTRQNVHTYQCHEDHIRWAQRQGEALHQQYAFRRLDSLEQSEGTYSAIAIDTREAGDLDEESAFELLRPGGSVVWIGLPAQESLRRRLGHQGSRRLREYGLIPPSGRVLLPLRHRSAALSGLELFNPNSLQKRWALRLARLVAFLGGARFLSRELVVLCRREGKLTGARYLLDWLREELGWPIADAAVFSGWERLTLKLLSEEGRPLGFAKLPETPLGADAISREAALLKEFSRSPGLHEFVPRSVAVYEWLDQRIHIESHEETGRRGHSGTLTERHLSFLQKLSGTDSNYMRLRDWHRWEEIAAWMDRDCLALEVDGARLREAFRTCASALNGRSLLFHRVHGDFTPWNTVSGSKRLLVVDWEESEAAGLPLADAVHFLLAPLLERSNGAASPSQLLAPCIRRLRGNKALARLMTSLALPQESLLLAVIYILWVRDQWWCDTTT